MLQRGGQKPCRFVSGMLHGCLRNVSQMLHKPCRFVAPQVRGGVWQLRRGHRRRRRRRQRQEWWCGVRLGIGRRCGLVSGGAPGRLQRRLEGCSKKDGGWRGAARGTALGTARRPALGTARRTAVGGVQREGRRSAPHEGRHSAPHEGRQVTRIGEVQAGMEGAAMAIQLVR